MRIFLLLVTLYISACSTTPIPQFEMAGDYSNSFDFDELIQETSTRPDTRSLADVINVEEIQTWLSKISNRAYDLKVSEIETIQQGILTQQTQSYRTPEFHLLTSSDRSKTKEFQTQYQSSHQIGARVSWELDLWNKISLKTDAASIDFDISIIQTRSLERAITASALKYFLSLNTAKKLASYDSKVLDTFRKIQDKAKQEWRSGFVSAEAIEEAKIQTLDAQATLHLQSLEVNELSLQLRQTAQLKKDEEIPDWDINIDLPIVKIPGHYILQRPDVFQSLLEVKKADIHSNVAYRSMFPSFTLSLDATKTTIGTENLLEASPLWGLSGLVTTPIFEGGRLRREVEVANYESKKALTAYKKHLQTAYYEVQFFKSIEASIATQLATQDELIRAAKKQFDATLQAYLAGSSDYSELAFRNIELMQQEKERSRLKLNQAHNRIDLFLALGLPLQDTHSGAMRQQSGES
jgi:outer membrane protein TolC